MRSTVDTITAFAKYVTILRGFDSYLWWMGVERMRVEAYRQPETGIYDIEFYLRLHHRLSDGDGSLFNMGWRIYLTEEELFGNWEPILTERLADNAMLAWALRTRYMDDYIVPE